MPGQVRAGEIVRREAGLIDPKTKWETVSDLRWLSEECNEVKSRFA